MAARAIDAGLPHDFWRVVRELDTALGRITGAGERLAMKLAETAAAAANDGWTYV